MGTVKILTTIISVLILSLQVYAADIQYIGEPERWNPVDTSPMYTQHAVLYGNKVSIFVNCRTGLMGMNIQDLQNYSGFPYGTDIFNKVCNRPSKPQTDNVVQNKEIANRSITASSFKATRKRVEKADKALSAKIKKGYIPNLPLSAEENASYMQLALNTKAIIPDKGFLGECIYKEEDGASENFITCSLFYSGKYSNTDIPKKAKDRIEMISTNFANSNTKMTPTSFKLLSYILVKGNYELLQTTTYDKSSDSVNTSNK